MSDQLKVLKYQAAETAGLLSLKIKEFQKELKKQMKVTPSGLLKYEVRTHPIPGISLAAILGFVSTYWYEETWGKVFKVIAKDFEPEIKKIKAGAIMLVTKAASNQLKEAYPIFSETISEILEEKKASTVPDEAITRSEELKATSIKDKNTPHPLDKYSDEKVSKDTPTRQDVKTGVIDQNVMPG